MDLVPEALDARISAEAAGDAAHVILGKLDPLVVTTGDPRSFEFCDEAGNGSA
jgi:hypothetical protein